MDAFWNLLGPTRSLASRVRGAGEGDVTGFHVAGPDVLVIYVGVSRTPYLLVRRTGGLHHRLTMQHAHTPPVREFMRTLDEAVNARKLGAPTFHMPAGGSPLLAGRVARVIPHAELCAELDGWTVVEPDAVHAALVSASALEGVATWIAMIRAHDGRRSLREHAAAWNGSCTASFVRAEVAPAPATVAEDANAKLVLATERECASTLTDYVQASSGRRLETLVQTASTLVMAASADGGDVVTLQLPADTWLAFREALAALTSPLPPTPDEEDPDLDAADQV